MRGVLRHTHSLIQIHTHLFMRKLISILAVIVFSSTKMQAQQLAVGTDVMLDLLQTPNIGAEMVAGERWTVGLNIFGNHKPWGQDMKMLGIQPEVRYFFSGRPMHKHFVGIGAIGASYDILLKGKYYDGTALGAGITFGYVFNITNRLNLDAHAGFGIIGYDHKEYYKYDNYGDFTQGGAVKTNATGHYTLPTRIGISLTYILR